MNNSLHSFLSLLEKEYISTEIRKTIYKSAKDKKYFNKVMFNKRIKIDNISKRLGIKSIFEDDTRYMEIFKKIANFGKMPKLTNICKKDFYMFYSQKTKFIFEGQMVKIIEYLPERNIAEISKEEGENTLINAENLQKLF